MKSYVLGFYFVNDQVALIREHGTELCMGKLNGLGGRILPGEMPVAAMAREFHDKSGIHTYVTQWFPLTCLVTRERETVIFYGEGDQSDRLGSVFTCSAGKTQFFEGTPNSFERIDSTALALLYLIRDVRKVGYNLTDSLPSVEPTMLTPREREIAKHITHGLSNAEIADCLVIETSTVKNHVHNILRKLGVPRRTQIATAFSGMAA